MIEAGLLHRTVYTYERPVRLGPQIVRLRPRPGARPGPLNYKLQVEPEPLALHWQMDVAANLVARLVLPQPIAALVLDVSMRLDMTPLNAFDFLLEPSAQSWPFVYEAGVADSLAAYRRADHPGPLLEGLCAATAVPGDTVGFVIGLAAAVRDRVGYIVRMEAGV